MTLNYLHLIAFITVCAIYSIWVSSREAKIKNLPRREKGLKSAEQDGYTISKKWDCNALTFFIDEKKKVLGFLVMAWRKDTVHYISIDDIETIEIEEIGIMKKSKIKRLITQICLNINTKQGKYVLRTLLIKGLGIRKTSKHFIYARKCADEIYKEILKLKK